MSSSESEYNHVEKRIEEQIGYYSEQSKKNKNRFYFYSTAIIILSALIPVLNSINIFEDQLRILISFSGAAISIFGSILSLRKHQELWIKYRNTTELLKRELSLYYSKVSIYESDDSAKTLCLVCENILASENSYWLDLHKSVNYNNDSSSTRS